MTPTQKQAKPLTYGELMMLCKGHGTSAIYERHLATLQQREREVWEEVVGMIQEYRENGESDVRQLIHRCRQRAKKVGT